MGRGNGKLGQSTGSTRGVAADELRRHNLGAVLDHLHLAGAVTRSQLTVVTGGDGVDLRSDRHMEGLGVAPPEAVFDPNGHRVELAWNNGTEEQLAELKRVAPDMLEEWSRTKKAPRHAAWLHELEFNEDAQ